MPNFVYYKQRMISLLLLFSAMSFASTGSCKTNENRADAVEPATRAEKRCIEDGWRKVSLIAANVPRDLLWQGPPTWRNGAIIVMHGGGGTAADFCSGGLLVRPQIHFTRMAIERGFAVFLLESTRDNVTDASGRACGKRFDFMREERVNVDVPYIGEVIEKIIPMHRPPASSGAIFLTGLSTGGYMTIRAATRFDDRITAFAPLSAGDPYGTTTNCDASLSLRQSAKGILLDNETGKEITQDNACKAAVYTHEQHWQSANPKQKPAFKQFHDRQDGIVDFSCMEKAAVLLRAHGYPDRGAFILGTSGKKRVWKHLWQDDYNAALLDFFESESRMIRSAQR